MKLKFANLYSNLLKERLTLWVTTLNLKPSLLCSSFISELEGELKEPTPLFEKSRVHFPGCGVYLYLCHPALLITNNHTVSL